MKEVLDGMAQVSGVSWTPINRNPPLSVSTSHQAYMVSDYWIAKVVENRPYFSHVLNSYPCLYWLTVLVLNYFPWDGAGVLSGRNFLLIHSTLK